jgi:hypothetical protein
MIRDLFANENNSDTFKIREKEIKIERKEKIFQKYKNMHISKALNLIQSDLANFTENNKAAKMQKDGKNI